MGGAPEERGKTRVPEGEPPGPLVQGNLFCLWVYGHSLWHLFADKWDRLRPLYKAALTISSSSIPSCPGVGV